MTVCIVKRKARVSFYRPGEVWILAIFLAGKPLTDKGWWADMSTGGTSAEADVDGSAGDGSPPVCSLTVHHFCLFCSSFIRRLPFVSLHSTKAFAPAHRSRYAPPPRIEKLICGVICQPTLRLCQTVTYTRHLQIKWNPNIGWGRLGGNGSKWWCVENSFMPLPPTICLACWPITGWKLHSELWQPNIDLPQLPMQSPPPTTPPPKK